MGGIDRNHAKTATLCCSRRFQKCLSILVSTPGTVRYGPTFNVLTASAYPAVRIRALSVELVSELVPDSRGGAESSNRERPEWRRRRPVKNHLAQAEVMVAHSLELGNRV